MKSSLIVTDLSLTEELDRKAIAAVRGGVNQAIAIEQGNFQQMFAPVSVGNGSIFGNGATITVISTPTQLAFNRSSSSNSEDFGRHYDDLLSHFVLPG